MTLSLRLHNIMTLRITILNLMALSMKYTQQHDTQHNSTQHSKNNKIILRIGLGSFASRRYADCCYADCRYADCRYADAINVCYYTTYLHSLNCLKGAMTLSITIDNIMTASIMD